jgi:N-acetylmuramoyl-L-alanine amidase
MKKIILQAGHAGRTTGATGSPNEQSFNIDICNKVSEELLKRGISVKVVGADPKPEEIAGDWDLFLSVHYDADIYGKGGGFVDFPEPSTDGATKESQRIAYLIRQEYFGTTGIVNRPERSNLNTRYYYMWKFLSHKTPCVIIECGVGMHVPDDHEVLHFNRPRVVEGLVKGICLAFNIAYELPVPTDPSPKPPVDECKTKLEASNKEVDRLTILLNKTKEILFGKGFIWSKINALKKLLA